VLAHKVLLYQNRICLGVEHWVFMDVSVVARSSIRYRMLDLLQRVRTAILQIHDKCTNMRILTYLLVPIFSPATAIRTRSETLGVEIIPNASYLTLDDWQMRFDP